MQIRLLQFVRPALINLLIIGFGISPSSAEGRKRSAIFTVTITDGKVDRIAIHVPATGNDYFADRFIGDDAATAREATSFRNGYASPGCTSSTTDEQCRGSCAFAENARPFTRLRRRAVDGRLTTIWPSKEAGTVAFPLKFYAGASSRSSSDGDCISPDGRFISLYVYPAPYDGERNKRASIFALQPSFSTAPFRGISSTKTYGEDRYFDFAGWKKGDPHTLRFNWGGDDGSGRPVDDEARPLR